MSIFYDDSTKTFTLETDSSRYVFTLLHGKYPVHLYYGEKDDNVYYEYQNRYVSFSPYVKEHPPAGEMRALGYSPDTAMLEFSGFGNGDFRATPVRIKNVNGDSVCSFEYVSHRVFDGRLELQGLPFADADENTKTLELTLADKVTDCEVKLYYTVFASEDIISRYLTITNKSKTDITIEKCMSLMLDIPDCNYDMISLYGSHYHERNYQRTPLHYGMQSICSRRGASSHQFNPFIAICEKTADEQQGKVFGFNFVFSGNFLDEVDVDQNSCTRVLVGLGSENFSWLLESGESFVSPEAVMTFSNEGIGKMSRNFHTFTRNRILPPEPFEKRPVVLNTWEACYFKIDEAELLRFADTAKECGIDMVVMDDGWFGERHNDKAALGDWFPNADKFKNGLPSFVDKMKAGGVKFGIWIEPEMINPDSDLYRAHPEWCLQVKGRENLLSRHQLVLDMANPDVIDYLKTTFAKAFDGVSIDYFKWDMNRHMSEVGSNYLPAKRQGETSYRYMLGVYELFRWFRKTFPNAMIENCSGGGGRYDLGMMKYSTMIWTSDNARPKPRIKIQYASMLAYPASTMSCHVSKPSSMADLKFRYDVALGGALGYEFHLPDASEEVKDAVREQVKNYREYEDLILRGDYYSLYNPFETPISAYYYADKDHDRILMSVLESSGLGGKYYKLCVRGAQPDAIYYDKIGDKKYTGKQLITGITYKKSDSDPVSKMWYFVKEK